MTHNAAPPPERAAISKGDAPNQDARLDHSRYVQDIFTRIAPRYDLMNRLMTGGQDVRWRRMVVALARIPPGGCVLDLGAGTGDLAREAQRQFPDSRTVAADFTLQMMRVGRLADTEGCPIDWSCSDALHLPFPDECFDAVISGFLLRNVADLDLALSEQRRVLKPGGRMVALDTTRPRPNLLSPFIRFHMRRVIPFLGELLTGSRDAYTYLPTSSENFLPAEELLARLARNGFHQASFRRLMFGAIAIHWGVK